MEIYDKTFFDNLRIKIRERKNKVKENNHFQLNPFLKNFWQTRSRYKILYGGRCSSKSHDAAGMSVFLTSNFNQIKFLCSRRFQARISDSVYSLVKSKIEHSPYLNDWKIYKTAMENKKTNSVFLFYGIERNLSEIKSTESIDVLWLEEANYITQEQFDILTPTLRNDNSEIWAIFNPENELDFIYDNFISGHVDKTISQLVNWYDNPWLNETMLDEIEFMYRTDIKKAIHIYGGKPKSNDEQSIIPKIYIDAAIDAHKKIENWDNTGYRRLGFDIADDGDDLCAMAAIEGNILTHVEEWEGFEDELMKSATKVWKYAIENNFSITYDSIGVGAFAGSKFADLNEQRRAEFGYRVIVVDYDGFNAGGAVSQPEKVYMKLPHTKILNKEHFENIKAQVWTEVAEKFRKTYERVVFNINHPVSELISIDSSKISEKMIKQIKKELSCVKKSVSNRGKFMAESKDSLRKRDVKSPNIADSIIMAARNPVRRNNFFTG